MSNNAQGAALGAAYWAELMNGDGCYVELFGDPSDNNTATRSSGYRTVIDQYPGLAQVVLRLPTGTVPKATTAYKI
ncbi:MAG: hypothetical protein LAT65_03420 [Saccharospirillum sp.]|nr:hypothetical protein [Saccharospirillum sp.]